MRTSTTTNEIWDWTRRWIPDGEAIAPWQLAERASTLEQLRDERLLVLVGDPGSGKSTEMNKEREVIESRLGDSRVINIDSKKGISSDFALTRMWFEHHKWKSWLESDDILYVFLDGLDELSNSVDGIIEFILQSLDSDFRMFRAARKRLRLRVGSRRVGLPPDFDRRLERILFESGSRTGQSEGDHAEKASGHEIEDHGPLVYALVPLSDTEIGLAAESKGLDLADFLAALDRRGFRPLAKRPKTLKFLISEFVQSKSLDGSFNEIYWKGLCQFVAHETGVSQPNQILRRAARIAFVMAFSKTAHLQMGTMTSSPGPGTPLGVNVFLEPEASTSSDFTPFTVEQLETLPNLNLFTGPREIFTWSELPDMEFLAAEYAIDCQLPAGQLLELLRNPKDQRGRVVPELSNVAAQLAGMNAEVFTAVLNTDPELLIRADSALIDDVSRRRVVKALLDAFESGDLVKHRWYNREFFSQLSFDEIADTLKPYISNPNLKVITRDLAIDIARDCNVFDVVHDLGVIVHSEVEDEVLRRSAAWTLYDLGTPDAIEHLSQILTDPPGSDELQELQGVALRAVWPNKWTLEKVLPHITPPESEVLGAYRLFLGQQFIQGLRDDELPVLYAWVDHQTGWVSEMRELEQITKALIERAVDALPEESSVQFIASKIVEPGELDLFRKSFLYESILLLPAAEETEKRRAIVEQLIKIASEETGHYSPAFVGACDLYRLLLENDRRTDIQWIADQATRSEISSGERASWFSMLRALRAGSEGYWMNMSWPLYLDTQYHDYLSDVFDPIDLNSQQAMKIKQHWEMFHQGPKNKVEVIDSKWFRHEIDVVNEKFSAESLDKWFCFDQLLRCKRPGFVSGGLYIDICERLDNWHLVDGDIIDVFVPSAKQYLLQYHPVVKDIGTNKFSFTDHAAYRAMTLLLRHSADGLSFLRQEDWQRLGPAIIAMPPVSSESSPEHFQELLHTAVDNGFDWRLWLHRMIESAGESDFYYRPLLEFLTDRLSDEDFSTLLEVLISPTASRSTVHHVASIFGTRMPEAVTSKLIELARGQDADEEIRVRLIRTALEYVSANQWSDLIGLFSTDSYLFEQAFLDYAYWDRTTDSFATRLSESDVANLYARLSSVFPPAEDVNPIGVHTVAPRESLGRWREGLLDHLVTRGTWEAVEALRELAIKLPQISWLPIRVAQAEEQARQLTWIPHRIDELLQVLPNSGARIVRSNEQLQAVVVESLRRLNAELQGESPAVHDLWTSRSSGISEPKYEEDLSDYIKRFLDRDLKAIPVFSNREVNNRPGERNDVYVEYASRDTPNPLKVVIEVKGCWNRHVLTNMASQLADGYMETTRTRFGIYVVGFFDCEAWPVAGKRSHDASRHTIDEVADKLERQAKEIEKRGKTIIPVVLDCRFP